ncbi:hypothetical protein UlMin_008116 [Ulmus minor]
MEEEKAAAYYDELTRRGEGAARFKQGLGFSGASNSGNSPPARGSALVSSSSSFLSSFVKASSPSKTSEFEKQAQIESIQNKLKKKKDKTSPRREEEERRPRVSQRERERNSRRRRSRSRERRRRSRSRSDSDGYRRRRGRSRSLSPRDRRAGRRSRSSSPRGRISEKGRGDLGKASKGRKERNGDIDYSRLIENYDKMTPAERVKAKMKLQLADTAENDAKKGIGSGWERFEFDKDAPLDDEEIEVAEDDAALVNHIGKTFRFSALEGRKEERIKAAHDEAMFGASASLPSTTTDDEVEVETEKKDSNESEMTTTLLSDKVLAKQQGSWRDRARSQRN